jgi:hypothetical protein
MDVTSNTNRLYLRHWGVLVSELSVVDIQVILHSMNSINSGEVIGTVYQLMQYANQPEVFVDHETTVEMLKTEWKLIHLEYVGTTLFTHEMIMQEGTYAASCILDSDTAPAAFIFHARPDYRLISNNCQNFAAYLLEALCPGCSIPKTISKVLEGMFRQLPTNAPPVAMLPGTYPSSTITKTDSYVTANEHVASITMHELMGHIFSGPGLYVVSRNTVGFYAGGAFKRS